VEEEQSVSRWNMLCNELDLLVDEVEEENPDNIAYVYSGYAPLSGRFEIFCIFVFFVGFYEFFWYFC
jgi:hypothetical protein